MTAYRFFRLDSDQRILQSDYINCDDDQKAEDMAYTLSCDFSIEVWSGNKRICCVEQGAIQTPQLIATAV
jgi:hypothetical protein